VLASLENAEDALGAGRGTDANEALRRARVGANAIVDLCQALRPLSQGRGARNDLIDLRQVIDSAALIASYEVRSRARLTVDVAHELPLLVGDSSRLGQVFLNLLLNAAQAIEPGNAANHEIRVSAEVAPGGGALIARVSDTGPGVDQAVLPRLFQPTATSRAAAEGHGMGLAICRWIVEEAGGTIRHVPGRERGAEFEVRLPLKPATPITIP
jgi:C4-dicarboxylate-specific signal transduction histidine kinase